MMAEKTMKAHAQKTQKAQTHTTRRNTYREDEALEETLSWHDIGRIFQYMKPYVGKVVKVVLAVLVMSVIVLAVPYASRIIIDQTIPHKNISQLLWICGTLLAIIVVYELCLRYRTIHIVEIGQLILTDMRRDIFTHIQTLPFSYFDSRPHGKILVRVVYYVNTLSDTLSSGLVNVISDLFLIVFTLIIMFVLDWRLTLWSLILFPILLVMVRVIQHFQHIAYQRLSNKQSNLNAFIHEAIAGVKTTQSFAREKTQYHNFQDQQGTVRHYWMNAQYLEFLMWPSVQIISTCTIALIYYLGIMKLGGVHPTTGILIAFIAYLNNFWNPIIDIGNFYNQLITCSAYLERIFETMDIKPEITDKPNAQPIPRIKGKVDFNDVTFRYENPGPLILKHVDFHVKPGQTIAFVGPTGAGKSTIVSLISRFYDVAGGSVMIDGHDVRDVTLQSLRSQEGVMQQDTFIFSSTVRDNIRYGKLDATDEQIEAAAKAVDADGFIRGLPHGYDTVMEEQGATLSAGQRQLVAFARTMLADPRILILDEATSDIDTKTEEALQNGIRQLLKGRTSFVIAHRLSTIIHADQIYYIDHGQIVEHGTHQELLQQKGAYWKLFESQYTALNASSK
jgi:ATP-binding cassette subfamily B multidrug efflux pump